HQTVRQASFFDQRRENPVEYTHGQFSAGVNIRPTDRFSGDRQRQVQRVNPAFNIARRLASRNHTAGEFCRRQMPAVLISGHLTAQAAVDDELRARDVAGLIGCKKQ
ncbi:MAG: hypothetical protein O3A06_11960, partial [Proteobacteria bacterium]|nr:hypothetical protein [Pseudomonadota bacterium]